MPVAQSSFGGVAIRYVLPVLWMTSRLAVMGRLVMRGRRCDTGAESDVYECFVARMIRPRVCSENAVGQYVYKKFSVLGRGSWVMGQLFSGSRGSVTHCQLWHK